MKKYFIFCNGSRGDCEPAICLAQYLINKNCDVTIFCNDGNEYLLQKSGIKYIIVFKNYIKKSPEKVSMIDYYKEAMNNMIFHINIIDNIKEVPDAVFGMSDQLGKYLAEKFNVPYYHIVLQYYDIPFYAKKNKYKELISECPEKIIRKTLGYSKIKYFNRIRQKNDLPKINDFLDYIHSNENTIIANSLILSNFDYIKHDKVFVSGNLDLLYTLDKSINQIKGLSNFLSNDTYYIYLNLGSWSQNLDNKLFKLYQEAFNDINCKVIIGCNRREQSTDSKFFFISSINPHELFPKIKLVIHCGGLGVAFKAALYGIPQIIIPKKFEEPFWAKKIKELGCGESIYNFDFLTSEKLNQKVKLVINNENIKHNASILSKSIDINGVENIYKKYLI